MSTCRYSVWKIRTFAYTTGSYKWGQNYDVQPTYAGSYITDFVVEPSGDQLLFSGGGKSELNCWKILEEEDSIGYQLVATNSIIQEDSEDLIRVMDIACFPIPGQIKSKQ